MAQAVLDVAMHYTPVKGRVIIAQIVRRGISEFCIRTGFCKLVEQGWKFAQMVRIGKLPDQIRGP